MMYIVRKYSNLKRVYDVTNTRSSSSSSSNSSSRDHVSQRQLADKELQKLNAKIDKLLTRLCDERADDDDEHEDERREDECVVCLSSRPTMMTSPCGHRVVCRQCFVKTIQAAVAQRVLPLRCLVCRTKILKVEHQDSEHESPGCYFLPKHILGSSSERRSMSPARPASTGGFASSCCTPSRSSKSRQGAKRSEAPRHEYVPNEKLKPQKDLQVVNQRARSLGSRYHVEKYEIDNVSVRNQPEKSVRFCVPGPSDAAQGDPGSQRSRRPSLDQSRASEASTPRRSARQGQPASVRQVAGETTLARNDEKAGCHKPQVTTTKLMQSWLIYPSYVSPARRLINPISLNRVNNNNIPSVNPSSDLNVSLRNSPSRTFNDPVRHSNVSNLVRESTGLSQGRNSNVSNLARESSGLSQGRHSHSNIGRIDQSRAPEVPDNRVHMVHDRNNNSQHQRYL